MTPAASVCYEIPAALRSSGRSCAMKADDSDANAERKAPATALGGFDLPAKTFLL
jgi:hypothetical protein